MRNFVAAALLVLLALPVLAFREENRLMKLVPGLNIITSFAHDYGERLDRVIFQDKEYKPGEATEKILPILNWNSRPDKLELGVAWARVFALHGCEVLQKGHYLWKDDFQEPLAEILEDGTFRYSCWVANMTGRNPGRIYFKRVEINPQAIMEVTPIGFPEPGPRSIQLP